MLISVAGCANCFQFIFRYVFVQLASVSHTSDFVFARISRAFVKNEIKVEILDISKGKICSELPISNRKCDHTFFKSITTSRYNRAIRGISCISEDIRPTGSNRHG